MEISRGVSWPSHGDLIADVATVGDVITFTYDMYVVPSGLPAGWLNADTLMVDSNYLGGHPINHTFPYLRVTDGSGSPELISLDNNSGIVIDSTTTGAWHSYEVNYTFGDGTPGIPKSWQLALFGPIPDCPLRVQSMAL